MITDDGRLERGRRSGGFSEMVRKTGFDPVASCTPSTRSAWLSYVLNKMARRKTRRRARCRTRGFACNSRSTARKKMGKLCFSEMVACRRIELLSGAPRPPSFPLAEHTIKMVGGVTSGNRTRIPAITRRCPDHWTMDTVNGWKKPESNR